MCTQLKQHINVAVYQHICRMQSTVLFSCTLTKVYSLYTVIVLKKAVDFGITFFLIGITYIFHHSSLDYDPPVMSHSLSN